MSKHNKIYPTPPHELFEFSSKQHKYCLLIPIINEGDRIIKELTTAKDHGIPRMIDIILCDGGSTDGSTEHERLQSLGVNTILIKKAPGKQGTQLRIGFAFALNRGYDGIITIDGNNKDSIKDVPSFIEKLDEDYDFVQGSRFVKGGHAENTPISRLLAVKLIHAPIISLTAGKHYTDTTNNYRAYSRKYLTHPDLQPFRDIFKTYELLAYLSVRADQLNLKTIEIPVSRTYPPKIAHSKTPTKISPIKGNTELIKILLLNLFRRYNP